MTTYTRVAATALAAVAALTLGCSSSGTTDLAPDPDASNGFVGSPGDLSGTWTRIGEVPGSSERWNLVVADTVVSGTGEWSGEACCSGQLTITGSLTGSTMHLKLRFFDQNAPSAATPRFVEKVDATLQSNTSLLGTAQIDTLPLAKAQWRKGTNPF